MKYLDISSVKFGTSGVRGLVADMSDEICYGYTTAFLQGVATTTSKVVLGHDLRPSSPHIAGACAAAIHDSGRQVIYVGALPTPALAFYAAQLGVPALVITGSHIPFDRNGIKFYRAEGEISKTDEQSILDTVRKLTEVSPSVALPAIDLAAHDVYVKRYLDFFGAEALAGFRIAIYQHSSVARDVLCRILDGLGAEVIPLGRTETFVPIDTEAVRAEDVVQARKWAQEHAFDAIVSTDGDADRPLIGDEQGNWLRGDVVGILCARFLQAQTVVTPVSSNTAIEKCGWFSQVLRTSIGSPFVIAGMEAVKTQSNHVVVGFEANGGFLLGTPVIRQGRCLEALPTRDAVLPIVAILRMAREQNCKLSQLIKSLPARYTASDRLKNFATEKSWSVIAQLAVNPKLLVQILARKSGSVLNINQTDGLRVTFENSDIVHLRPSGNAPELRCYAEAESPERARILCDECLQRILSMAK